MNRQARCYLRITRRVQGMPGEAPPRSRSKMDSLIFIPDLVKTTKAEESVAVVGREPLPVSQSEEQKFIEQETVKETEIEPKNASVQRRVDLYKLSNIASVWFLGLFMSIILTSVLELQWSGVGIEDLWRNEQFWVIGGVSAHLFAVFQGFLKMLAGLDTNFTVTSKASDDGEFGELYIFKWTTLLIPPTTLLVVNMVGVVAGFSDALNSGYESWGPLFGKVFFAFWVILHLYPFLKGLMGRQNRTPTIVVLWSVLLASVFSLIWVKIDPFLSNMDSSTVAQSCISIDC